MANEVGKRVSQFLTGSAWALLELLLTLFVLFYLLRDRRQALATLRSLVPLSERETDEVFVRVADTIHATIFGTLVVAAVQGALGGLIFWWLGLPAPALLAIVPVLGAFVIWLPAAIFFLPPWAVGKSDNSDCIGAALSLRSSIICSTRCLLGCACTQCRSFSPSWEASRSSARQA
jgi:predicted PurR-regulated permease PerM